MNNDSDIENTLQEPIHPEVVEENVLICEECGCEMGFVQYFVKEVDICPVCENKSSANSCRLVCEKCRGGIS